MIHRCVYFSDVSPEDLNDGKTTASKDSTKEGDGDADESMADDAAERKIFKASRHFVLFLECCLGSRGANSKGRRENATVPGRI